MLVIDAAASRNDPIKALPTFYKSVAIVLNIFLTYPFYKLLLKHIDNLSPSASKTEGAKNHGRSICLVSTHLAFAYVSALGSFAWFALYVLIIGVGFKEWPGWHAVLIMLYVAASVSLLVFALCDINRLVQFEKYRTYVEHYEPHGDSNGSGGILLPGVWPDTINNPLSWFRIGLAVLSVAAALV